MEPKQNANTAGGNTIAKDIQNKTIRMTDKMNMKLGNPVTRFILLMGASFVLTYNFIAPVMKQTFLIATWNNVIFLYGLSFFIGLVLFLFYNLIMKLLLYIFS